MANYDLNSITHGNDTYNLKDNSKIPLSGTNALSGSIVPDTDNSVDIGASSKNIKMIYTKGITINGTQFLPSNFVNLTTAQTIAGDKTFTSLASKSNTLARGSLPTTNIYADPIFISFDKNNRRTFGIYNNYDTNGDGRVVLYAYNQNTTDYDNIGLMFSFNNANGNKSIYPNITNSCDLGTSTYKWKSINGIAPDELGLPTSTYTDVSSYITHFDGTPNTFTAPAAGLLNVIAGYSSGIGCVVYDNTTNIEVSSSDDGFGHSRIILPVEKGHSISVYINQSTSLGAKIFHLKGKV